MHCPVLLDSSDNEMNFNVRYCRASLVGGHREDLDCEMRRLKDEKYQYTFGCEKVIEADEK